jgi:hypothetical protein
VEDKAFRGPTTKSSHKELVVERPPVHALHDDMDIRILFIELSDQAQHRAAIGASEAIPKADGGLFPTTDDIG